MIGPSASSGAPPSPSSFDVGRSLSLTRMSRFKPSECGRCILVESFRSSVEFILLARNRYMCVVFKTLGREKLNEENSTNNMETYIAGRGAETTYEAN